MEQINRPAMYDIVRAVAKAAGVSMEEITGYSRADEDVTIRWAAMLLGRRMGHAMDNIGRRLSRDHTTVLHGIRKAKAELQGRTERGAQLARIMNDAAERLRLEPIDWGVPVDTIIAPPPVGKPRATPITPRKAPVAETGIVNKRGEIICNP